MSLTPNHHSLTERIGWPSPRQNLSTSRSLCSCFTVSQVASFGLTTALFLGLSSQGMIAQALPQQQVAQVPQGARVMATTNFLFVNPLLGDNATGTGGERTPFRTITHALQVAKPSTIILLAPGTYNTQTGEVFPLRLKPGVTVQGDSRVRGKDVLIQGGGPFLSPTAAAQNITILAADQAGLAGVTVTNYNPRGYGLWIESASPIILDNHFTESTHDGISVVGNSAPVIRGNYFYRNGASGISVFGSSRPEIRENTFEQTGFGVNVAGNAIPLIVSNQIRSNEDGIVIQGNAQPIVRGNLIENNRRDGLVAIAQARPDLGTELEPGGNVFRGNSRFDVNSEASTQIIPAFGNQLGSRTNGRLDLIGRAKQVEPSSAANVEAAPTTAKPQSLVGPTTAIANPASVTTTSSPNQPTQTVIQPRITREVVPAAPTISVISANSSATPANPSPAAVPPSRPTVSVAPTPTPPPARIQSPPAQPVQTQPIPIQVPQPEVTAQPTPPRDRAATPPASAPSPRPASAPSTPPTNAATPPVARVTPPRVPSTGSASTTPSPRAPRNSPTATEKPPAAIAPAKPVEPGPAKPVAPAAPETPRTTVSQSTPAQPKPTPRPTPPITQPNVSAASFPVPASLGANNNPNPQSDSSLNIARAFELRSQPTQTFSIQSAPVTPPPSKPTPPTPTTSTPPTSRPSARATEQPRPRPTVRPTEQPKPLPSFKPIEQPKPTPAPETAIEIPVPPPESSTSVAVAPVAATPPRREVPSVSRRTQPPAAIAVAPTPAPATAIEISVPPPETSEVSRSSLPIQPAIAPPSAEPPTSEIAAVSNPDILPVPGLEIPVGNGGGELPAVIVPRNPLDRSVNSPPVPVTATSSSGSSNLGRYRVIVEVEDEAQQDQVRSLIPNAFRTVSNGRVVMQVGSFSDRANADKMTEMLASQGLKAAVEQI